MKRVLVVLLALILAFSLMGCGKSKPATEVDRLISSIGEVTLDSEEAIIEAEDYYETLTEGQRDEVENYKVLVDARKAYNELARESQPGLGTWKAVSLSYDGKTHSIKDLEKYAENDEDVLNITVVIKNDKTIAITTGKDTTGYGIWRMFYLGETRRYSYIVEGINVDFDIFCNVYKDDLDTLYLTMDDVTYGMERAD